MLCSSMLTINVPLPSQIGVYGLSLQSNDGGTDFFAFCLCSCELYGIDISSEDRKVDFQFLHNCVLLISCCCPLYCLVNIL